MERLNGKRKTVQPGKKQHRFLHCFYPNQREKITVSTEPEEIMDINYFLTSISSKFRTTSELVSYLSQIGVNCYIEKNVLLFKTDDDARKAITGMYQLINV